MGPRLNGSLFALLLLASLFACFAAHNWNVGGPKEAVFRFDIQDSLIALEDVAGCGQSPLVAGTEFGVHDGVGKLEVGFAFLVAFKVEHAGSEVVVNCSRINSVAANPLLSNFTGLQVTPERPGGFFDLVKD